MFQFIAFVTVMTLRLCFPSWVSRSLFKLLSRFVTSFLIFCFLAFPYDVPDSSSIFLTSDPVSAIFPSIPDFISGR